MQQRLPSLLGRPIAFAHRGARAHARENTIEAFRLALVLGASGLESDVWLTADGVPVLDHDGVVRVGRRNRPITGVARDALPAHVPELTEVLQLCGAGIHLSLDLQHSEVGRPVVDVVRAAAPVLLPRLWLCHQDVAVLADLRSYDAEVRLVNSTRLARIREGAERRAATLAAEGIDGVNFPHMDWSGGLTTLFHRFGRTAFAWDLHFEHHVRPLLRMGIDAVYGDHVDVIVDAFRAELGVHPGD